MLVPFVFILGSDPLKNMNGVGKKSIFFNWALVWLGSFKRYKESVLFSLVLFFNGNAIVEFSVVEGEALVGELLRNTGAYILSPETLINWTGM